MKVGLISDTHGILDMQVTDLFDGVEHILHAGDIGDIAVIDRLRRLAPVTAVAGNCDRGELASKFPQTAVVELAGRLFFVTHIRPDPFTLRTRCRGERPDVVVFGHSHKAARQHQEGMLFVNPGGSGCRRLSVPRSVAIVDLTDGIDANILYMDD